jgi:hypothetical protein
MLSHIPFVSSYILKYEISAGIGDITSNSDWVKPTIRNGNIPQSNVLEGDQGLRSAAPLRIKRIKHTSRSIAIGLFHLLRTNVYRPPLGSNHGKVLVDDIRHYAVALISRISLYVDTFQWIFHVNIAERNIFYAVVTFRGRYAANGHANPQYYSTVLY